MRKHMPHFLLILLGFLLLATGARSADFPIGKGGAVEYVKICSLYGAGFFYIPGSDTCIRMSGIYVGTHVDYPCNAGLGSGYIAPTYSGGSGWGTTSGLSGLGLGGLTGGGLRYDFGDSTYGHIGNDYGFLKHVVTTNTPPPSSSNFPDLVGNIRIDQAWGSVKIAIEDPPSQNTNPNAGWAVGGGLVIPGIGGLSDSYVDGAKRLIGQGDSLLGGSNDWSGSNSWGGDGGWGGININPVPARGTTEVDPLRKMPGVSYTGRYRSILPYDYYEEESHADGYDTYYGYYDDEGIYHDVHYHSGADGEYREVDYYDDSGFGSYWIGYEQTYPGEYGDYYFGEGFNDDGQYTYWDGYEDWDFARYDSFYEEDEDGKVVKSYGPSQDNLKLSSIAALVAEYGGAPINDFGAALKTSELVRVVQDRGSAWPVGPAQIQVVTQQPNPSPDSSAPKNSGSRRGGPTPVKNPPIVVKLFTSKPDIPMQGSRRVRDDVGYDRDPAECKTVDGKCSITVAQNERRVFGVEGDSPAYSLNLSVPYPTSIVWPQKDGVSESNSEVLRERMPSLPLEVRIKSTLFSIGDKKFVQAILDAPGFDPSPDRWKAYTQPAAKPKGRNRGGGGADGDNDGIANNCFYKLPAPYADGQPIPVKGGRALPSATIRLSSLRKHSK